MTDIFGPAGAPFSVTVRPSPPRAPGVADTWFKNCSSPGAKDGTDIEDEWLNGIVAAARVLARGNGQLPNGEMVVDEQKPDEALLRAVQYLIQRGVPSYAIAGGTANALTVSLTPALGAYTAGLVIRVALTARNTGPVTIDIDGLGAKPLVHKDKTPLQANELSPGQIATMIFDGTAFQVEISYGRLLNIKTIYVSGVYTPTAGTAFIRARVQGGGGAGAGATLPAVGNVSLGSPGTCGAFADGIFTAAQIGASSPVTVGLGGVAISGGAGGGGGSSSIGVLISAPGGIGGGVLNNQVAPTVNGTGVLTADPTGANVFGFKGGAESVSVAVSALTGYGAPGATSLYGKGGAGTGINGQGSHASGYGSGGAGCIINNGGGGSYRGGNGAPGIIIIEEYSL